MAFPYVKQVWADLDVTKPVSAARMGVIEDAIALAGVLGTSSTPPASPVDGMIWRLPAASGSGVYWFFQYDSSQATNKWVFMGGAPWVVEVTAVETTASTAYVDLATVGPSITIPRAGDYLAEFWVRAANNAVQDSYAALKIGAAATSDNDAAFQGSSVGGAGSMLSYARVKAFAASDVAKLQYRVSGGTGTYSRRTLKITPIRVI